MTGQPNETRKAYLILFFAWVERVAPQTVWTWLGLHQRETTKELVFKRAMVSGGSAHSLSINREGEVALDMYEVENTQGYGAAEKQMVAMLENVVSLRWLWAHVVEGLVPNEWRRWREDGKLPLDYIEQAVYLFDEQLTDWLSGERPVPPDMERDSRHYEVEKTGGVTREFDAPTLEEAVEIAEDLPESVRLWYCQEGYTNKVLVWERPAELALSVEG